MAKKFKSVDGNTAAANVAYAYSEVAAIYPITPSSPMGESADSWSAAGKKNIFNQIVHVQEMQSEGGAAGAIHGSLTAGALTTTFTASQGLMLMLPNMFKIAGELLPCVFHVSARSLAYQSLSIFGDHSDVMTARSTGFSMLASGSVQEAQDMAAIAHLSSIEARLPFLHFFDGFRTSHEVQKIETIDNETLKSMFNMKALKDFRKNALNPEHPSCKVGAENPDVYFQGRERANKYHARIPGIVRKYMDLYAKKTGRKYGLFDYCGSKDAEKVIIMMGSGADTAEEAVNYLSENGEKIGVLKVRLYRPFSVESFIGALPDSVKKIAVLDRTKESGSVGEPLYLDVVGALKGKDITIIGGRYGLSSKEFTPSMVKAVFAHLDGKCTHDFTVGIDDDLSKTSIEVKEEIDTEQKGVVRCKFWGYGSDGTVSANKNSIKIIGDNTDKYVQAYFSYDSKKSGGITVSHLRFSDKPIQSGYLLNNADFIALHKPSYIGRYDILAGIADGGTFLLNTPFKGKEIFESLTEDMQKTIIDKKISFYAIDATKISKQVGLGNRINTVMQAAFFKISGIIPEKDAIKLIKDAIEKQFSKKGEEIVKMNWECVDNTVAALEKVEIPATVGKSVPMLKLLPDDASDFAKEIIEPTMRLKGDEIPVSKMPLDGSVPTATTKLEKRGVADMVPEWIPEKCIQCGRCSLVCPHASIRIKQMEAGDLKGAPDTFTTLKAMGKQEKDMKFKVQVYAEDCQGCTLCVNDCPVKDKALKMVPIEQAREKGENENEKFFDALPDNVLDGAPEGTVKWTQLQQPLFEFSGACAGCGETPYVKLVTQLFGRRMIIANATGCSSIYGGTFPTIPYCQTKDGKGPCWANSLFEDNAEYGYGMRLALNSNRDMLHNLISELIADKGSDKKIKVAFEKIISMWNDKTLEAEKAADEIIGLLPDAIKNSDNDNKEKLQRIYESRDFLVDKSVWIVGGDGWAYDIGYGGLDHVLAQGKNVNVLVLDTEVYSNTGGQASKATPLGATAKFASAGKRSGKKNMGLMMMTYGNVYVASVAMGANQNQVVKALREAESYDGPSIVFAYSPCIAHGIDMTKTQEEEKKAVDAGYWPLYRYNPESEKPLTWDCGDAKVSFKEFLLGENRYRILQREHPDDAERLFKLAEEDAKRRADDIKTLIGGEK